MTDYDVIVIGGGPAGATAAETLARGGASVLLLDKAGRIKPCGGAVPPRLLNDYAIPSDIVCAAITSARMVAPSENRVDMPIENGSIGMVDRDVFDEFLRGRAERAGATRLTGTFKALGERADGRRAITIGVGGEDVTVRARLVIGADGARSAVAKQAMNGAMSKSVFAYHEIIEAPQGVRGGAFDPTRCDVYYQGKLSPDFYAWIFPHGRTASIGVGSAHKGFSLRGAVRDLRAATGLDGASTIRTEGAPIPLKPLKRWDNGTDVVVVGDAAGVVAPCSGEGIYYAMRSAEMAAEAAQEVLAGANAKALRAVRKRFMKEHGRVFLALSVLQWLWYVNDKRRERFVTMCADKDVQQLTFDAYMNKRLVRRKKASHLRVAMKDLAHLLRLSRPAPADAQGAQNAGG